MTSVSPCRSALPWIGAKGPRQVDNGDPASLGPRSPTFEYAIARKGDDVARIEESIRSVYAGNGTGAQPHVERERDLRDAATFSRLDAEAVDSLVSPPWMKHHVGHGYEPCRARCPDIAEGQRIIFVHDGCAPAKTTGVPSGTAARRADFSTPGTQEVAPFDERRGEHDAVI